MNTGNRYYFRIYMNLFQGRDDTILKGGAHGGRDARWALRNIKSRIAAR